MDLNLEGKAAIVTGGARGIGKAIAENLVGEGMKVYIFDVNGDEARSTANEIAEMYKREVTAIEADIRHEKQITEAVKLIDRKDVIYALVNNAGITRDALLMRMKEEDLDLVVDVNLKAAMKLSKHIVRPMMKANEGRIVNISSVVGLIGSAGQTNYSASKAGLIGFTKSLAREVASRGITVNAIAPGYVETAMTDALPEEVKNEYLSKIPLGYASKPKDVADLVTYLVSARARYITGEVIRIDGGLGM